MDSIFLIMLAPVAVLVGFGAVFYFVAKKKMSQANPANPAAAFDRRWIIYIFLITLASMLVFGWVFVKVGHKIDKQIGHIDFALATLHQCPDAAQLLGEPIEGTGPSKGVAKNAGGGFGYASWSMGVQGPRAKGTYTFNAEMHNGTWSLTGGTLQTGNQTLNVLACLSKSSH